jgi:Plasmid encoded RepA protein
MSAAEQSAGQGESERLARHLRLLEEIGLPPPVRVRQLLIAGFAPELIRPHFPQLPASAFVVPEPAARQRPLRTPAMPSVAPIAALLPGISQRLELAPAIPARAAMPPVPVPLSVEGISFQYVPLIQCSFPHTDPGPHTTHYTRRNGWLELTLSTARPDTGLPYGVPARLLTMYCASEAVRTRSPEIFLGSSVHEFLRRLDVPITRGERGSLRSYANQLLRLASCAISIDENIHDGAGRTGMHIRQALFAEETKLWWDTAAGVGQGSSLILSPVLYESILERSAPLSTNAIRQLRKSPMDLDVYAWLAHRLFQLSRPSTISWAQLSDQFGHDYAQLRYFRRFFSDSLKRVLKVYPDAKLKASDTGITLLPSRPHVEPRIPQS